MKHAARKIAVIAAVAFAIGAPALQALTGWGQSAAEFSRAGEGTLKAAGYAFSIWSVIYAGLAAFAIYQALPRSDGSAAVRRAAWPAAVAIAGCGTWICAAAADLEWASVTVILVSLAAAVTGLMLARGGARLDRLLVAWPLGALAGWLTDAAVLNVLTVLTDTGRIGPAQALPAALAGIAAASVVALAVLRTSRLPVYALPVAWGLVAVFVAERARDAPAAWTALAAAALVLVYAGVVVRGRP
jgi:hypothetical protein